MVSVTGAVAARHVRYVNGGYALLGQLVTDLTGLRYEQAATRTVLERWG